MSYLPDGREFRDPIVYDRRTEAVPKTDLNKMVINNRIVLDEKPSEFYHVQIDGMYEIFEDRELAENEFKVDYTNKIITFHPSKNLTTIPVIHYYGLGNILVPADTVYVHSENPNVLKTLQDEVDDVQEIIDAWESLDNAIRDAEDKENSLNESIVNANTVKSNLDTSITTANNTRDALDGSITGGTNKIAEMDAKIQEVDGKIVETETAMLNAQTVADNTVHKGEYSSTTTYYKNNIVSYQGSSYMCIVSSVVNVLPTDTVSWKLVALKGLDGVGGDMYKFYYDSNEDGIVNRADTADKLTTARTINLTGDVSGSALFNGENDISIDVTCKQKPSYSTSETKTAPAFSLSSAALEAPFKQFDVKGRTYTNLLVNYGDFETDSDGDGLADGWVRGWRGNHYGTSLDTAQSVSGKVCQRITPNVGGTSTGILDIYFSVNTIAGKYYFVSGYAQGGKILIQVGTYYASGEYYTAVDQRNENWVRHGVKVLGTGDPIYITLGTNATEAAIFDAWMVNEIEDEYSDLSIDELMQRYPYVNGTKGTGPLEIKSVGKNLVKNGNGEYGLNGITWQGEMCGDVKFDPIKKFKIVWGPWGNHIYFPLPKLKPNTQYTVKFKTNFTSNEVTQMYLKSFTVPMPNGAIPSGPVVAPVSVFTMLNISNGYATATFATPSALEDYNYLHLNFFKDSDFGDKYISEISLIEGDTPLEVYEPYQESVSYTPEIGNRVINSVCGGLISYPSGTISIAPRIRFTAKPIDGVITVLENYQSYPIKSIVSLKKIVDGVPSEDATVSSFTDTTITPDNVDNDAMYEIVYDYGSENTTIPEITYSYAINRAAQADQTAKGLNDVTKRVSSIEDILSVLIVMSN